MASLSLSRGGNEKSSVDTSTLIVTTDSREESGAVPWRDAR